MRKYVDTLYQAYGSRLFETTTFVLFFWLILGYFHLYSDLDQMIYGPHYWRQADGLAQAMNYTKNGLNFFDHSLYYNQFNGSSKAVGEFPIMYYWVALQKSVFGGDINLIFRANYLIVGFFGMLALFKIAQHYIKNIFLAIGLTFILFCSPVFSFYFLAAMPDPLAFNLSVIGYWMLIKYFHYRRPRFLVFGVIVLSVAFMVKLYFILPFLAFIIVALLNGKFKIDPHCYLPFKWIMLLPIVAAIGWLGYMLWYNAQYDCNCFLSGIMPFWEASADQIATVRQSMHDLRYDFLAKWVWLLFLLTLIYNLLNWNKKYRLHNTYLVVAIMGGLCFFACFFLMFHQHDYYIYPLLFILPVSVGLAIVKFRNQLKSTAARFQFAFLFLTVILFGIQEAVPTFDQRKWDENINHSAYYESYIDANCLLEKSGVGEHDLVFSISDHTPNYSLVLMDRKGWSGYQSFYLGWTMEDILAHGADFMIVNEENHSWDVNTYAEGYRNHFLGSEDELFVYDLRPYRD